MCKPDLGQGLLNIENFGLPFAFTKQDIVVNISIQEQRGHLETGPRLKSHPKDRSSGGSILRSLDW